MIKHYYNTTSGETSGVYLGQFDSEENPPANAVGVIDAPQHGLQIRDGNQWVAPTELLTDKNEEYRQIFETGGMVLSAGMPVSTSENAQSKISAAKQMLAQKPAGTKISFAASSTNFIQMELNDITLVFDEVAAHVQAAYTKQGEIVAKILSGQVTTLEGLAAEWAQ